MRNAVLLAAVLLAGCSGSERRADAASVPPAGEAAAISPSEPSLLGSWTIRAVDDRPPAVLRQGGLPGLAFDENGVGGNAGCNGFGSVGLAHEGRWYGGFALSTAMACGDPYDRQEALVVGLLRSGPRIVWRGKDKVDLVGQQHRITLGRGGGAFPNRLIIPPAPLTGSLWSFGSVDGQALQMPGARQGPTLMVEGESFKLNTPCLTLEGRWHALGNGSARFVPDRETVQACPEASKAQSRQFVEALKGDKRHVSGPNGEIVIAGGGHWLVGDEVRRGASQQSLIQGLWRIDGGPTAEQRNGARPPEVRFAGRAYYLWDGCNHTEGLAILYERTLHAFGSGMSTLANCMDGRNDPKLAAVVTSSPRVGLMPNGELAFRSQAGELRLVRAGPAVPDGTVSSRLVKGMRFALLDGGVGGTLKLLAGGRFRLSQPCGVSEGRWRAAPRETDGGYRFAPERQPGSCQGDAGARQLHQTFTGNLHVAIGPNRENALFVGRFGAVPARMAR